MSKKNIDRSVESRVCFEQLEEWVREQIQFYVQELLEDEVAQLLGRRKNERRREVDAPAAYAKAIDWNGVPAAIGAGIYQRDIPGTCNKDDVNATVLAADPSNARLKEFVRCAAMELESQGYFATRALSVDPRWSNRSIYVFGLDTHGYTLFSGDPYSHWYGLLAPELNDHLDGPFGGRDVVSVGDAFGETFLYYSTRNPATGMLQRKVTFVKRVVAYGLPILVGSGYYLDEGP